MTNEEAKEKIFYQWQKFLENNIDYAGISEAYKMAIKALEQEPKTGWIPVSEKLPGQYERVLVTIQTPSRTVVRSGQYLEEQYWIDNGDFWKNTDEEIKAWMPLPEPYKAESEESE